MSNALPAAPAMLSAGVNVAPFAAQEEAMVMLAALILKNILFAACTFILPVDVVRLGAVMVTVPSLLVLLSKI